MEKVPCALTPANTEVQKTIEKTGFLHPQKQHPEAEKNFSRPLLIRAEFIINNNVQDIKGPPSHFPAMTLYNDRVKALQFLAAAT